MVRFKATNSDGEGEWDGTHEDLGMCYVSKIVIDGTEILSVIPATPKPTAEERMKVDNEAVAAYGFKIDYKTVQYDHSNK